MSMFILAMGALFRFMSTVVESDVAIGLATIVLITNYSNAGAHQPAEPLSSFG